MNAFLGLILLCSLFIFTVIFYYFDGKGKGRNEEKRKNEIKITTALKKSKIPMNGEYTLAAKFEFKDGKLDIDSLEFTEPE